jgi:hypothetical protein
MNEGGDQGCVQGTATPLSLLHKESAKYRIDRTHDPVRIYEHGHLLPAACRAPQNA